MIWFNNQHVNIQNQNLVAETGLYISRQMTHLTLIDNETRTILRNAVATAQERSLISSDRKRNKFSSFFYFPFFPGRPRLIRPRGPRTTKMVYAERACEYVHVVPRARRQGGNTERYIPSPALCQSCPCSYRPAIPGRHLGAHSAAHAAMSFCSSSRQCSRQRATQDRS